MDRRIKKKYHRELKTVFMLNFLPYKPTGPVSSNIYRPPHISGNYTVYIKKMIVLTVKKTIEGTQL
jgi:hypothetical protein